MPGTPLLAAYTARDLIKFKKLCCDKDTNPNEREYEIEGTKTILQRAVEDFNDAVVEILLSNPDLEPNLMSGIPNEENSDEENEFNENPENTTNPLLVGCSLGDFIMVDLLLNDSRVLVNVKDNNGWSPLTKTCSKGHTRVVERLMKHPEIDLNQATSIQETPFYLACEAGHIDIVKLFLADPRFEPDDINRGEIENRTPFLEACSNGHIEIVKILLADCRVDPTIANRYNQTPLYAACGGSHADIAKLLVEDGRIDVNIPTLSGTTPFRTACCHVNTDLVEYLLQVPDLDPSPEENLKLVCRRGDTVIAKVLFSHFDSILTLELCKELAKLCVEPARYGPKVVPQTIVDISVLLCQASGFSTSEIFPECEQIEAINNRLQVLRAKPPVGAKRTRKELD